MTKGLEALERLLGNQIFISLDRQQGKKQLAIDLNTIEKELKTLEIIKEKKIKGLTLEWDGTWWTVCVPNYPYPIAYGRKKEEYDLLKEVLL